MATSETEIANIALTRLGQRPITSLDQNSPTAEACNLHYPLCRDTLLRSYFWRFAITRTALSPSTTAPAFEFSTAFPLPPEFLRLVRTSLDIESAGYIDRYGYGNAYGYTPGSDPYRLESVFIDGVPTRCLVCNEASISIEYVAKITDVAQFDPMFTDVLAQFLAAQVAMLITDNAKLAEQMVMIYKDKIADARSAGAMEGTPRQIVETNGWLVARA